MSNLQAPHIPSEETDLPASQPVPLQMGALVGTEVLAGASPSSGDEVSSTLISQACCPIADRGNT